VVLHQGRSPSIFWNKGRTGRDQARNCRTSSIAHSDWVRHIISQSYTQMTSLPLPVSAHKAVRRTCRLKASRQEIGTIESRRLHRGPRIDRGSPTLIAGKCRALERPGRKPFFVSARRIGINWSVGLVTYTDCCCSWNYAISAIDSLTFYWHGSVLKFQKLSHIVQEPHLSIISDCSMLDATAAKTVHGVALLRIFALRRSLPSNDPSTIKKSC